MNSPRDYRTLWRNVLVDETTGLHCPACGEQLAHVLRLYCHALHCRQCKALYTRNSTTNPIDPDDEDSDWRMSTVVGDLWLTNITRRVFRRTTETKGAPNVHR